MTAIGPVAGTSAALPSGLAVSVRIPMQQVVAQVASALGMTANEVSRQLAGGSSLAQIAASQGVSVAELIRVLGRAVLLAQGSNAVAWNAVVLERALASMINQRQVAQMTAWDPRAGWVAASQLPTPGAVGRREERSGGRRRGDDEARADEEDGERGRSDAGEGDEHDEHRGLPEGADAVARRAAAGYQAHEPRRGWNLDVST